MNNQNQNTSQEIDLHFLRNNFTQLFSKLGFLIFRFFRFLLRNKYVVLALVITGLILGYFLDSRTAPTYKHRIILALNFDSSSYLYNKTKNLDKTEFTYIQKAKIEPIIDVSSYMSEAWENIKTAEFMAQNNISIHQYKEGNQTEKIYRYHTLTLTSHQKDENGSVVNTFLDKINQEPYYLQRQKIETEMTDKKIKEFEKSVQDLNVIFESLGSQTAIEGGGVKIETQNQTNDLLNNKQSLLGKISKLKILRSEQTKVFYDLARITNIKESPISNIIKIPVIFILLFTVFAFLKKLYRRYALMQTEMH